jgi:hypothetical protein
MRSPSRTKFANTKQRKKKLEQTAEVVAKCDNCGIKLKRTCQRTANSAICAEGVGISTKVIDGAQRFFCSINCRKVYESRNAI